MDRAIVLSTVLLVGLTWLLYKLAVLLEPRGEKAAQGPQHADANVGTQGMARSSQQLIHRRLRK